MTEAVHRLCQYVEEGRILRHRWSDGGSEGWKKVCLLTALEPMCAVEMSPNACPEDVLPAWVAHLTPWMNDAGSENAWPTVVRRYAAVIGKVGAWTPEQSAAAEERALQIIRAEAHPIEERRAWAPGRSALSAVLTAADLANRVGIRAVHDTSVLSRLLAMEAFADRVIDRILADWEET